MKSESYYSKLLSVSEFMSIEAIVSKYSLLQIEIIMNKKISSFNF